MTAKAEQKCQTKEELHHSSDFLLPASRLVLRLEVYSSFVIPAKAESILLNSANRTLDAGLRRHDKSFYSS